MGAKTKKISSAGRFGAGYGTRVRKRLNEIESMQRKKQICLFCNKPGLKRESSGIWHCVKCGKRYTGASYVPIIK